MADYEVIVGTLDPGHGGNDRYNIGVSRKYIEPDGVLDICKRVQSKLNATKRFSINLTRDEDKTLGLTERARIAKDRGAKFIISNHSDAGSETAKGVTCFYSVDLPNDKVHAERFSQMVAAALGTTDRGAKTRESIKYRGEDYYTIIDASQDYGLPHVFIIENGFHTNVEDEAKLRDPAYRDKIAEAQARAICIMYGFNYDLIKPQAVSVQPIADPNIAATKAIQTKLNNLYVRDDSYDVLEVDGSFGPRTKQAVLRFQRIAGLTADGTWGPATESAYNKIVAKPNCSIDNKPDVVVTRYIQYRVNAEIDGAWGPNTDRLVKSFQKNKGLGADGKVGPLTWGKLIK